MKIQDHQHQAIDGNRVLVKADVIAKIYDTDVSTIYKWATKGKIPSETICGIKRFHVASVRQKLEGLYQISEEDIELGIFC